MHAVAAAAAREGFALHILAQSKYALSGPHVAEYAYQAGSVQLRPNLWTITNAPHRPKDQTVSCAVRSTVRRELCRLERL